MFQRTLALIALLILPNLANTVLAQDYSVDIGVTYANRGSGDLQGDFYKPLGIDKPAAVVMIHGGGWIGGERADMDGFAKDLAEEGFAVLNITYRLGPEHRFPAAIIDCRDAVRWLRSHADRLDINPDKIGAWGYSAGGHLAALLGTLSDEPLPGEDTRNISARVQAVIDGAGPTDLRQYRENKYVTKFMPEDASEQLYELASPVTAVSSDDAPTLMYHGKRDAVVFYENSVLLKEKLDAAGVPNELVTLTFGHVTSFLFGSKAEQRAYHFLREHL